MKNTDKLMRYFAKKMPIESRGPGAEFFSSLKLQLKREMLQASILIVKRTVDVL